MKSLQEKSFILTISEKLDKAWPRMLSTLLRLILIGSLVTPVPRAQAREVYCSDVYYRSHFYAKHYAAFLNKKLGGAESQWKALIDRLIAENSPYDLARIEAVLGEAPAVSWLQKNLNFHRFFVVESVGRTLDQLFVAELNLSRTRSWEETTVEQRRALLLLVFKKWWWEVDSHFVMGFSRWTDASYLISRKLTERVTPGRLDSRLHELISTASQTGFFSQLISNFRAELRILEGVKDQPQAREILLESLKERLVYLQIRRYAEVLEPWQIPLIEVYILRTAVLREMLVKQRTLEKSEIEAIATALELPPNLARDMRWGQAGLSLLPTGKTFTHVVADIAVTSMAAFILAQIYLEMTDDTVYKGNFQDIIEIDVIPD